jgi:hypothetical protein
MTELPEFKIGEKRITIEGHDFLIREMSGDQQLDMVQHAKDRKKMQLEMLKNIIISPKVTDEWLKKCPSRVITQILLVHNELTGVGSEEDFLMTPSNLPQVKSGEPDGKSSK